MYIKATTTTTTRAKNHNLLRVVVADISRKKEKIYDNLDKVKYK
jgi:uncharacterized protein with NAD-binding domain and iron-sulfur cluster